MCREEGADPDQFGLGSQSDLRGWTEIVGEIRLDLASLNRIEMLCWDTWGIGSSEPFDSFSDEDKLLLDRVAKSTLDNSRFEEWESLFQHKKLHIPSVVESYSPAAKPDELPIQVHLKF